MTVFLRLSIYVLFSLYRCWPHDSFFKIFFWSLCYCHFSLCLLALSSIISILFATNHNYFIFPTELQSHTYLKMMSYYIFCCLFLHLNFIEFSAKMFFLYVTVEMALWLYVGNCIKRKFRNTSNYWTFDMTNSLNYVFDRFKIKKKNKFKNPDVFRLF